MIALEYMSFNMGQATHSPDGDFDCLSCDTLRCRNILAAGHSLQSGNELKA